jgi:carboxyl-terminal processing protease
MSTVRKWVTASLLIILAATTVFVAGFGVGRYVMPSREHLVEDVAAKYEQQFQVFWEAWRIVEDEFYSEKGLDYQAMIYGAVRGMVASLGDPHTAFLTPAQADMFSQDLEGSFGGIGVTIGTTEDGYLQVVRLIPGGPAEESTLKPGDAILEVDGTSILGLDMTQAISLIRGPQGTTVRLLVRHAAGGVPEEIVLTRTTIQIPTTESRMLDNGIAYLRLWEFNDRAADLVHQDLETLLHSKPRGLILDLRGNPGGYLHSVEQIANEFIPEGLILIERSSDGQETRHEASGRGIATEIPLAVLVDGGSASASEILAGAIQDHKRGILIGERTYGKGSVQVTERLSDRSGLAVTIRRWYTPADRAIDGTGLTPDIDVTITQQDLEAQRDPQLERAISHLFETTS